MSDPKDNESFLRKVVRFVANPATDWNELGQRGEEIRESEYAKSELKAMIERKRRNDFVRKREFDMLRKVRREGLTSEQLAALGGSSRLDDSEGRMPESSVKADNDVKAKINEIEQQMVGDNFASTTRKPPPFYSAPTQPAGLASAPSEPPAAPLAPAPAPAGPSSSGYRLSGSLSFDEAPATPPLPPLEVPPVVASPAPAAPTFRDSMPPLPPIAPLPPGLVDTGAGAVEITEAAHDPDLDEAVIAFANADFEACEQSLVGLTSPGGLRAQHAETWLVLFDLYRAIGELPKFEALAVRYAHQFGLSAPQWFSMPQLVTESKRAEAAPVRSMAGLPGHATQVGWVCPDVVDAEVVGRLRSQTLQMPLPWVFDWSAIQSIDAEASARLDELFRHWMPQPLSMRWVGGERLLATLAEAAPTGVRDVDPAHWQLRLDALRLANRADQFDEAAIDYCVTYEVSPPSWERTACTVRITGSVQSTTSPPLSEVGHGTTTLVESQFGDELSAAVQVSSVELTGQLVGDIGETLRKMDTELGTAAIVNVSCARLIRVDFIAAGDLLNWVLQRRAENRTVGFSEAQRLVALFFGAMGITEHAKVKVRSV